MSAKGNQIRNKMIKSHPKTDREKLAGLEVFLHEKFPTATVVLEPHMMFTKGEDEFVGWDIQLNQLEVMTFTTHPPDALLVWSKEEWMVLELDGPIHDIKVKKTNERDLRCQLNDIMYVVVNERDLKFKLGIAKSALLPQTAINEAFLEKIKAKLSQIKK